MGKVRINRSAYNTMLYRSTVTILMQYGRQVEFYSKKFAPHDTGYLRSDITTTFMPSGAGVPKVHVGSGLDYGLYQHEGTGIYGPRNRPIKPKHSKFLVFTDKYGNLVFAKSVRGAKPTRYLYRALKQVFR